MGRFLASARSEGGMRLGNAEIFTSSPDPDLETSLPGFRDLVSPIQPQSSSPILVRFLRLLFLYIIGAVLTDG